MFQDFRAYLGLSHALQLRIALTEAIWLRLDDQGLDGRHHDHHSLRLGPSLLREGAEGTEGTDDASHGRDDGQGQQQHLHHLPPGPHVSSR